MRRAAKVDANHEQVVTALRAAGASVLSLAAVGNGCPDLLVHMPARYHATPDYRMQMWPASYYLLEVKDGQKVPSARKLTKHQEEFHQTWQGPIYVVKSPEEALKAVGAVI